MTSELSVSTVSSLGNASELLRPSAASGELLEEDGEEAGEEKVAGYGLDEEKHLPDRGGRNTPGPTERK